jgi:hypothetical protein
MIQSITNLLSLIKKQKVRGRYIDIALGENKLPETIKEGYELLKKQLWQKK